MIKEFSKLEVKKQFRSTTSSFGVAHLDLSTLLNGLKLMEFTLPIVSDQLKGIGNH